MSSSVPRSGVLALLGCVVLAGPVTAQDTPIRPLTSADVKPAPSDTELQRVGLETTPFSSELLGLSIHLPADAHVNVQQVEGGVSVLVSDPSADPPQWTLRMGLLTSMMEVPTPQHEIDAHIRSLEATGRDFTILRNDDHTVRNAVGRHLTIRHVPESGDEPIVSGWFLLQNSEKTFLVLSYVTSPHVYSLLQPLLDASFDTILLRTVEELDRTRRSRVEAGLEFLSQLDAASLRAMVGQEQWLRVYRPGPAGDEEIGYSLVRVSESKRGEVDPGRSEERYHAGEHEEGLMITVQGRVLNDASRPVFTDSIARFWVNWNQEDEVWGVRSTVRQGEASFSESETGARHKAALPNKPRTMTVVRSSQRDRSTQPVTWDVPEAYLSQGLGWIVGPLLAHQQAEPRTQSYYYYDANSNQLILRTDEWSEVSEGAGHWRLTTRLGTDAPPIVSRYAEDGTLIRQRRIDGTIVEPIDLAALRKLWRDKGLPTSSDRQ